MTFYPRPQIMKSGVKNTINVCQYVNNVWMRHYSLDISVNPLSKNDMKHMDFYSILRTC